MPEQALSLSGMKGGALEERFQRELQRLLLNIRDPNTSRDTQRSITIQLTFKPSDDRQFAAISTRVTSKLAPDQPVTTFALFDFDDGVMVATERIAKAGDDPRQTDLGDGQVARFPKKGDRS
jgi:hypothetical protein